MEELEENFSTTIIQFAEAIVAKAANTIFNLTQDDFNNLLNQDALKNFDISLLYNKHPDESPAQLVLFLMHDLLNTASKSNNIQITPWILENTKTQAIYFQVLLGPVRKQLSILIRSTTGKIYQHNLTEELACGILIGVRGSSIRLYLKDSFDFHGENTIPLTLIDLINNYDLTTVFEKTFIAMTSFGKVTFDSLDFIRGIITGATWVNINPKSIITNIFRNGILVTF